LTYNQSLKRFARNYPNFGVIFDPAALKAQIEKQNEESAHPDFWKDSSARTRLAQKSVVEKKLNRLLEIEKNFEETAILLELLKEDADPATEKEAEDNLNTLQKAIARFTVEILLGGPKDFNNAILTLHPGAGGTESADWAAMLTRMYMRWAERRGFRIETLDLQPGEEAGIKSITLGIEGDYAYGYLRSECGVHRLVRISPFDANKRRHTSFAAVFISPEIEDDAEVAILDKDLRIDTYRSSSAGGQHVNKTSSAIRITHLPTNTVVQCQNERSQLQNKQSAMKVLRSRLYELQQKEKEAAMSNFTGAGEKKEIAWGHQIRSYVMQPYQIVKDHRTSVETGNVPAVLDGEIDLFIEGYLGKGG
jgi:peptide chain release factor 2